LPLRAVENRIAIARAANTGVSALIAPDGRVGPTLPLFERGFLTLAVPLRSRATLYTRFGNWLVYVCLALSAGAAVGSLTKGRAATC